MQSTELELAEKKLELLEMNFGIYSKALGNRLLSQHERLEEEMAIKEQAITAASTPAEQFFAHWDKELFSSLKNKSEMETFLVELKLDVAEQGKRLAAEQEELAGFRELLSQPEASRKAGDRIKSTILQLKRRRILLNRPVRAGFSDKLLAFQERRYTVDDTLFSLNDLWQEELNRAEIGMTEKEVQVFTLQTALLPSAFRNALREEKGLLTEVITLGQRLQYLSARRLETISEHERFIRSKVFWLQDVKPMGIKAMVPVGDETVSFLKWGRGLAAGETGTYVLNLVKNPMALVSGVLLLFAGPVLLFFLWRRFRGMVKIREAAILQRDVTLVEKVGLISASVASPVIIMVYCLLLARFMLNTGLPNNIKPIIVVALEQTGFFLFFWSLSRIFLGPHGLLPVKFKLHREAARALYTSLQHLLFLYISWLLLCRILAQQPFNFEALPRICYTVFELLSAIVIFRLIRPASPWIRYNVHPATANPVSAYWPRISQIFIFLMVSIIFLDLAGYRYGAQSIARSTGLSLMTLMLFPALYTAVTAYVAAMAIWRKPAPGTEPLEGGASQTIPAEKKVLRIIKAAFLLLLLILLAMYWGIDQQALKTLEEIQLYQMRGAGDVVEFVSAADLIRSGLYITGTLLLLRWLPGLYEFVLMPRLRLDEGMKYAVLTLSRYGIFILGVLLTLAEMHLDLGRPVQPMGAEGTGPHGDLCTAWRQIP